MVMTISPHLPRYFAILALTSTALVACGSTKTNQPETMKAEQRTDSSLGVQANLTLVTDVSQVCMVNDHFMGSPQIPVLVEGKTYYGCCAMCKSRLESEASARTAVDPVTHTPVDKATATIGKTPSGSVIYFANHDHFDSYARQAPSL
jgi:YHS domain-containing protein